MNAFDKVIGYKATKRELLQLCDILHQELFQSTPPARGATLYSVTCCAFWAISIHAPPRGGRRSPDQWQSTKKRFQSTPPARGATISSPMNSLIWGFQSTPPARGATM